VNDVCIRFKSCVCTLKCICMIFSAALCVWYKVCNMLIAYSASICL